MNTYTQYFGIPVCCWVESSRVESSWVKWCIDWNHSSRTYYVRFFILFRQCATFRKGNCEKKIKVRELFPFWRKKKKTEKKSYQTKKYNWWETKCTEEHNNYIKIDVIFFSLPVLQRKALQCILLLLLLFSLLIIISCIVVVFIIFCIHLKTFLEEKIIFKTISFDEKHDNTNSEVKNVC